MPNNEDNIDNINLLQQLIMHGGEQAFSLVPAALEKVVSEKQWQRRVDKHGKPFASFEAFVTQPLWHGLETTIDDLRVFCRKHPGVRALILAEMDPGQKAGGDHGNQHTGGKRQTDNISLPSYGTSATYTLKRLKRERRDLFDKVCAGELSANAAAIEAGFRKKPVKRCPKCGHEW
jgi:hypothetical protein